MDRVLSARIGDAAYRKINDLSQKMHVSKKSVIEKAIELLGKDYQQRTKSDVFDDTSGVWRREEALSETHSRIRGAFRRSMHRHQR